MDDAFLKRLAPVFVPAVILSLGTVIALAAWFTVSVTNCAIEDTRRSDCAHACRGTSGFRVIPDGCECGDPLPK